MSIPDLYNNVISGLLRKSQANKVIWNTTTDPNTFIVFFNKSSLSIRQDYFNHDETDIAVDVINNNGDKIDRFVVKARDDDWERISELYALARRSALSIDTTISEMLTELNKNGTIGQGFSVPF
jgi:hypothetical protein